MHGIPDAVQLILLSATSQAVSPQEQVVFWEFARCRAVSGCGDTELNRALDAVPPPRRWGMLRRAHVCYTRALQITCRLIVDANSRLDIADSTSLAARAA